MLSKTSRVIAFPCGRRPKGSERSEESHRVLWQSPCTRSLCASLCRDDTITEIVMLVDNCYIISNTYGGHWRMWFFVRSVRH